MPQPVLRSRRRHPPDLVFPLDANQPVRTAALALLGGSLLVLLAWHALQASWWSFGRQLIAAGLLVVWCGLAHRAWRWLRRLPVGKLSWQAGQWEWHDADGARWRAAGCRVVLDLQWSIWLCLRDAVHGREHWLWVQRRADPAAWHALRQAVVWSARQGSTSAASGFVAV